MAKIKTIRYEEASGRLKEIYDDLVDKRGKLASVHTIQSLRPESIVKHINLYLEIMFTKSELSRAEREIMAVIVSKCNSSFAVLESPFINQPYSIFKISSMIMK